MRRILLQLDTDEHPSPFDAIVAYDAGADVVLGYGRVTATTAAPLVQGAFFTRAVSDLDTIAVWVGGSDVAAGMEIVHRVREAFFGPFKVSVMVDSNGCNTTSAPAVALMASRIDLHGRRAMVIGLGPVGLRTAKLLAGEGCEVTVAPVPPDLMGHATYRTPRGLARARAMGLDVLEPADRRALEAGLDGVGVVFLAGPAGVQILGGDFWRGHPTIEAITDYNATEPLGAEGIKATDFFAEYDGKLVLGALAVGQPKMRTHRACVARLFERNDLVLDAEGVYAVARDLT